MKELRRGGMAVWSTGALLALVAMAALGQEQEVSSTPLNELKAAEATKRAAAARALADIRPIERGVVEALMNTLPDSDDQVRRAAQGALQELSTAQGFSQIAAGLSRHPRLISSTKPKYPQDAFNKRIEGTVVVEMLIDRDGTVLRARIVESVSGLDEAALEAVRTFLFAPAVKNGRLVQAFARVPVNFRVF